MYSVRITLEFSILGVYCDGEKRSFAAIKQTNTKNGQVSNNSKNDKKIVSEYDQKISQSQQQTNSWHREEEPHNNHETQGR